MTKDKNNDIYCVFCSDRELVSSEFWGEIVVKCNEQCLTNETSEQENRQQNLFDFKIL